jgi:hypothetical protein
MFNLSNILKAATLSLAVALSANLAGQQRAGDKKMTVAPIDPSEIPDDLKPALEGIKAAFNEVITARRGFSLFVWNEVQLKSILNMHKTISAEPGDEFYAVFNDKEARDIAFQSFDYLVSPRVIWQGGDLLIEASVVDMTSVGQATASELVEHATYPLIRAAAQRVMTRLLDVMEAGSSGRVTGQSKIEGEWKDLFADIKELLEENRSNSKWYTNFRNSNYSLGIDFSRVTIDENKQLRMSKVGGRLTFTLEAGSSGSSTARIELEGFTAINKDLIQKKILEQVRQKQNKIVMDLLSNLN